MFFGFLDPDPDPLVRGMDPDPTLDPDPSIIKQILVRKTLISTVLGLLFYFLSLKNAVKVPSKSTMRIRASMPRSFPVLPFVFVFAGLFGPD